jgi:hypothetical protein
MLSKFRVFVMELLPCKRIGEQRNIARTAVWRVSDYADWVNGISLSVDGATTLCLEFATGG